MLVVISPAKTLDFESPSMVRKPTSPDFYGDSVKLARLMRRKKPAELRALMGISDKLAALNHARFKAWSTKPVACAMRPAILAFMGDVYAGLDARTLSARELEYAQSHLRILSGLYGLLRPFDLMQAYRLEMGTALANARGADLYAFWGSRPAQRLNEQAAAIRTSYLVNLASSEYFKAVDRKALALEVVTPVFKDRQGGQYKVVSFFAKKARGMMTRFIVQHRSRKPADLRAFTSGGYAYNAAMSTPASPVFTRDGGGDRDGDP